MVTRTNNRMIDGAPVNVRDFGAVGDGIVDDTVAIQSALDVGGKVVIPKGVYNISATLLIKHDFTAVSCNGSKIQNLTNEEPLLYFGDASVENGYAQYCTLSDVVMHGNATTTQGIKLWSSSGVAEETGALWNDSSKKNILTNVQVNEIGAGTALSVYSWANSFRDFTVYREPGLLACLRGIVLKWDCNSNTFDNTYLTGCDNEGIRTYTSGTTGAVVENVFNNTTVQYCGSTTASNISIDRCWGVTFNGLYGEIHAESTAPYINLGGSSINVKFKNIYLLVNTGATVPVLFYTEGQATEFDGIYLNANSPKTVTTILEQGSSSTATMKLDNLTVSSNISVSETIVSPRPYFWSDEDKIDIFSNDSTGGNRVNLRSPKPTIRIEDTANSDSKSEYIDAGRWRVITRDDSAGVESDFINYDYTRPVSITNGFSTPEGSVVANPGSIHMSTSGALYIKVTGLGNTGWKQVSTV